VARAGRSAAAAAVAVALAACAACGGGGGGAQPALRGIVLPDRPAAPGFTLHDEDGRTVSLAGQRGRWVLLTFLYTYCPDVCPVIAGNLNAALRTAPAHRAGLRVLAVSVDPARDTPARVRAYARSHQLLPSFRWLLGTRAQLAPVWREYKIAVLPGAKKTVSHSTVQLLIDPSGRERLVYDATVKTGDVVDDLRTLADE
jgi:protein SCO1/2